MVDKRVDVPVFIKDIIEPALVALDGTYPNEIAALRKAMAERVVHEYMTGRRGHAANVVILADREGRVRGLYCDPEADALAKALFENRDFQVWILDHEMPLPPALEYLQKRAEEAK
jgi:hypothetical protein